VSSSLAVDPIVLLAGLLALGGVVMAGVAERLRAPALLLFLALGMVLGDDGLDVISFADAALAQSLGVIALVLILYEGGLTTRPSALRGSAGPGLALATVGVVVTAAVTAGVALAVGAVEPMTALLLGAIVSSTDAAAVFSLLRRAPLPPRLTSLLEVESGLNDPVAVLLTVGLLATWAEAATPVDWVVFGALQLGLGLAVGAGAGAGGVWLLRRVRLPSAGLYSVLALSVAAVAYGTAVQVGGSGFLAVYLAGVGVGSGVPRHRRGIRTFHEGLANSAEIGLFLMLGLLVFPAQLPRVAAQGLLIAAGLALLARPLAVLAGLGAGALRGTWRLPELALVSWTGLRGAVPIVLATYPLTAGYPEGPELFNTVFFVVLVSTAVQGSTVAAVAARLGLRREARAWEPSVEALPLDGVEADLVEVDVTPDLPIAGRPLRTVPLPAGALMTMVVRDGAARIPTGDTVLSAGDQAVIAVPRTEHGVDAVRSWAEQRATGT